jgi:hypothetical protein
LTKNYFLITIRGLVDGQLLPTIDINGRIIRALDSGAEPDVSTILWGRFRIDNRLKALPLSGYDSTLLGHFTTANDNTGKLPVFKVANDNGVKTVAAAA